MTNIFQVKCGTVLQFGGVSLDLMDALQNFYNKPFHDDKYGKLHTYAIYIAKHKTRQSMLVSHNLYYLIWKPFIGFIWQESSEFGESPYAVMVDKTNFDKEKDIIFEFGCEEIGLKQKDFDKWCDNKEINQLVTYLHNQDPTIYQEKMKDIQIGVKEGRYDIKSGIWGGYIKYNTPQLDIYADED